MRTYVYVDGFNLYFRMLRDRPALKWLNLHDLTSSLLGKQNCIEEINYYSAPVSGRVDAGASRRQRIYFNALRSTEIVKIHLGSFLRSEGFSRVAHPPRFEPPLQLPQPWPRKVWTEKFEEKGSDVNLASHLVRDACLDRFDVAVVVSNDTDLIEPMRIARQEFQKTVGLLSPVSSPNPALANTASFVRRISPSDLARAQFPDRIVLASGTVIERPDSWA
jgi:uncharacterized LabA/DUF88 family protein